MAAPTIIHCLRSLGFPVPADAMFATVDSQEDPTWIEFADIVDGTRHRRIGGRHHLSSQEAKTVKQAVQLHYVGYRLSRKLPPL